MDKTKRTAIRMEQIDGETFPPTMIGESEDLLALACESVAYIIDSHPRLWGAARAMTNLTLDATKPRNEIVWELVTTIFRWTVYLFALFGLFSLFYLLSAKGVI